MLQDQSQSRGEIHHVHLDAVGGVAGDMFVAAMLSAFPGLTERVMADVAAVLPASCGEARLDEGMSCGVRVLRFGMLGTRAPDAQAHGHHHHDHHGHHSPMTHFDDMVRYIGEARLHSGTAEQAVAILTVVAQAESKIHGVPIGDVHFHEIADWDSLMDVVAAGSIAAALENATWSVSELPIGGGQLRTSHGLLPMPAPATVEILQGFRWRDDGIQGERVTPTGAAILAHLVGPSLTSETRTGLLRAVGMGAGTRDLAGVPNVLRVLAFARSSEAVSEDVVVLSFDVDDMTGEEIGTAADRLRGVDGVLDLTLGNRQGKKNRPVTEFQLLLKPGCLAAVSDRCFLETSSIGLRWRRESRTCLYREAERARVDGQEIRRKRTVRPFGQVSLKAESDDLTQLDDLASRRKAKQLAENDEKSS